MVSVLIEIASCVIKEGGMLNSVLSIDRVKPCRLSWLIAAYSSYCLGVWVNFDQKILVVSLPDF